MTHKRATGRSGSTDREPSGGESSGKVGAGDVNDQRILIEVDPVLPGGHVHGRFDITVRGRVVSVAAITEVRMLVDGRVTSTAVFGQSNAVADTFMPDAGPVYQRAFQFSLPRPGKGRRDRFRFQIVASAAGGLEDAKDFTVEINPIAADPVAVVSGNAGLAPSAASPEVIIYIERGTLNRAGVLRVHGWTVSLQPVRAVHIWAGSKRLSDASIGMERDDVAAAFPAYPDAGRAGFSLMLQLDDSGSDLDEITAQVVRSDGLAQTTMIPVERGDPDMQAEPVSGDSVPLEAKTKMPPHLAPIAPDADIRMFCDAAEVTCNGRLSMQGWAVCAVGVIRVRVLLDGEEVGLASYGHDRPDVAANFPGIPMAHLSGFRLDQCVGDGLAGEHEVSIVAQNMHGNEAAITVSLTVAGAAEPRPTQEAVAEIETMREHEPEFRLELDAPVVSGGAAVAVTTGHLTIEGWLLTRSGISSFEVFLDGRRLGDAHYGLVRHDVGAAFPEWPNALRSGFAFHCPPRSLRGGNQEVELRIRSNSGRTITRAFQVTVKKPADQQDVATIRRRIPHAEAEMVLAMLADIGFRPRFQVILIQSRLFDAGRMRATLEALRLQAYPHWSVLALVRNASAASETKTLVADASLLSRFRLISPADTPVWDAPLVQPDCEPPVFHLLVQAGDEPGADALLELAVAAGRHAGHDMIYSDEVRISPVSGDNEPFFKPDFSIDLLLSTNYIGRLWTVSSALLEKTAITPAGLIADGEYDFVLRCTELAAGVHHVPKLLCQRSAVQLDDPEQERTALERMLRRRGIAGDVLATPVSATWRVKRAVPATGKVSIIIPTCAAHGHIETCLHTLRTRTAYRDFEIICIDNIAEANVAWKVWLQQNADKVVEASDTFNWSIFNNRAAEVSEGEFLLFLNDDVEIIQDDWLDAMMEHARRPEVGVIGARLLYPDGTVQHAGMFLSNDDTGRHAFRFAARDDPGYFGLAVTQRNVIAVTGACTLVRRETFEQLGQFNTAHQIINNDLDFCLRAHRAGLLTVFTPYATLIHHELASRESMADVFDLAHFSAAWKTLFAAGDPYFNPRLSRHEDDYCPDAEPVQWVVARGPVFRLEEIQHILVVKLDHIGDFVTALPPIRRLKKLFPHARLSVLAAPTSRAVASLEPLIDEFIPFTFFHARSQLGERELTQDDYTALAQQLRPYRFDLAIDLRKHLSTRCVLKHTGARFLVGFDYLGQFPLLDIALEWDGDRGLQRKRRHVVDDLMALVDAVGHASEADRMMMQPSPDAMPLAELPEGVRVLFEKPVVAVHPGAGNVTKQWPEAHYSALIDLLIEQSGVNVLLIGGPDDIEVATALLNGVLHPNAIGSTVGKGSLADLPRLLKNCALFIGNDSGPKHIAAAVGIPTIGIHSGVVDPVEWGPVGPNAIALRRNMTCSPCYIANAEDCPRALACLRFLEPNMVYQAADMLLARTRFRSSAASGDHEGTRPLSGKIIEVDSRPARKPRARRRQPATEPA